MAATTALLFIIVSISLCNCQLCENSTDSSLEFHVNQSLSCNYTTLNTDSIDSSESIEIEVGTESAEENESISLLNHTRVDVTDDDTRIEFIESVLCHNESDYRFFHLLVDLNLQTSIAEHILMKINKCSRGGMFTTR